MPMTFDMSKISPDVVDAYGRNERELITHRIKTVLSEMEKNPKLPADLLTKLAAAGDGQGIVCCNK